MQQQKVTIKAVCANPLFEDWLTEWRNQETNQVKQNYYDKALESLKKFPLPMQSGTECIILQGFGEKLCKKLDRKLEEYNSNSKESNNEPLSTTPSNSTSKQSDKEECDLEKKAVKQVTLDQFADVKKKTKDINYLPVNQSGAFAILCTLYKSHCEDVKSLTKKDIVKYGQSFCNKNFLKKDKDLTSTPWSEINILVSKGLVLKGGNPAIFSLSEHGLKLAEKLYEEALNDAEIKERINQDILVENNKASEENEKRHGRKNIIKATSSSSLPKNEEANAQSQAIEETFFFPPNSFKILLLVDTQETSGCTKKNFYDEIIIELNKRCVDYKIRHLKVGDYAWICRHKETQRELVLPYIIERKRMDDFGASIKDGRFHEQKFRLKSSGIQNLIYLVESHGNNTHCGLPLSSIFQAATNTLLQDNFSVKYTENTQQTAEYLATFSKSLIYIFKDKTLMSCPKESITKVSLSEDLISLMTFQEFNISSSKNKALKINQMFIKQLLQLNGISVDKAIAIVEEYPTPRMLKIAYDSCMDENEAENLLANIEFGSLRKKIGPVISSTIHQLYTFNTY